MLDVDGFCPMGCGRTLFLAEAGDIVCSWIECPRRTAVTELLEDQETEHVVLFGEGVFTVRHPMRERLDDELMHCQLHEHIAGLSGPPVRPGRYRARSTAGTGWTWELLAVLPSGGTAT
jgi:Family of unknown function (DUF6085)